MLPCTHLCVLLVSGEAATKKDERLHALQKSLATVITARSNCNPQIRGTEMHNITEVMTKDVQGSVVLCQEQEVAILSECVVDGGQAV